MIHARRAVAARQVVLGVIAVALIAAAVFYVVRYGSGEKGAPTGQTLTLACDGCGAKSQVTHREFEQMMNRGEFTSAEGGMRFKCPKCGQMRARSSPGP